MEDRLLLTTVVVNSIADVTHPAGSTVVSLRDAVNIANKSTTPTTITFSATAFPTAKKIALNGHALELSGKQPVTITGPAASATVNAENESAVFIVDKGVMAIIASLTVRGGSNVNNNGGGIENYGKLTLNGVAVSGNDGGINGGGIYNGGTLVINNSTVSNNFAGFGGNGGGIDNAGSLILNNDIVSNNSAGDFGDGGGIENEKGATMTVNNTSIAANSGDYSGGIENVGTATLFGVTISVNTAIGGASPGGGGPGSDGGIGNYGKLTLTDCTVAGNSSNYNGGGIGNHGALTLYDSTIAGNSAGGGAFANFGTVPPQIVPVVGQGGGLDVDPHSTWTIIQNTIIAGNSVTDGIGPDAFGAVHSSGYNLVSQTNGSTGWKSTDRTGTTAHPLNALLSPLASFGGPTRTLVPLSGSPAIDHGSNALVPAGITADQRGLPRIANGTVDIGAVEVQPSSAHIAVTANTRLTASEGLTFALSAASFTETSAAGPYTADVNWGDGTPDSLFTIASPGALPRVSHSFAEEGNYHGVVTVFDSTGHNSAPTAFTVKVADGSLTGSAPSKTKVGAGVPFALQAAAFNDTNPDSAFSDFSATINWGDGTTSAGDVGSQNAGQTFGPFEVTGTHTYSKAGTYTFAVKVTDIGGATLTVSSTVTCVNPKSIVVNTTKDQTNPAGSATVSLRDAVALADGSAVPAVITFDPKVFTTAKTITLTGAALNLTGNTTSSIVGPSARLTISGNGKNDVFDIDSGVDASLAGLTITNAANGIVNQGVAFLSNCSLTNTAGDGVSNSGFMVLTGVTLSGNQSSFGSAIANLNTGNITLIDCTVADNNAGVQNQDIGTITLLDSTLSTNSNGLSSGGGLVFVANTIIAGNSTSDVSGSVNSLGFNLVGQTDGSSGWISTDRTGTAAKPLNARLGPLANNGGPTLTLLPQSGSPAINHGSNALVPQGLTTDQRGLPRIVGGIVDIGAVEV